MKRLLKFFSSLRLTVACLCMFIVLIFFGTLAQVDLGIWEIQARYFRSFFIYWSPAGGSLKIPVWPGGYLLGSVLFVNLIAAHVTRFQFTKKKTGLFLIHIGILLLLLGQFVTDRLQVESTMRLEEGQTKNYSDSTFHNELAVIDVTSPDFDTVVSIPERMLKAGGDIQNDKLPFVIHVKSFYGNSDPRFRGPMMTNEPPQATDGVAGRVGFVEKPLTYKPESKNVPAAVVEISDVGKTRSWVVSPWISDEILMRFIREDMGRLADAAFVPQEFEYHGHRYQLALRATRYYKPFAIQLLEFRHDIYAGTDTPKNFSSLVRLQRPQTGEDRQVKIYMNNPLRYGGETFYQASFEPDNPHVTILQDVKNPGWLTPYFACSLVAIGLVTQFLMHLFGFAKRRKSA